MTADLDDLWAAPDDDRIQGWASALAGFGLELDCVAVLHVGRIAEIGHEAFTTIVDFGQGGRPW